MIAAKIGGAQYMIPSEWEDITIRQAVGVLEIPMPESLMRIYREAAGRNENDPAWGDRMEKLYSEIPEEDIHKHLPEYRMKVLSVLCEIPEEVLRKTNTFSITSAYNIYMMGFENGLHFLPTDYKPELIDGFTFEGIRYCFPKSRKMFSDLIPMFDATAIEFTESADLMIGLSKLQKDFRKAALLIAILCRPDGERYDEATALNRADRFLGLPMSVVWDVFFSLITQSAILKAFTETCLQAAAEERKKAAPVGIWNASDGMEKSFISPVKM